LVIICDSIECTFTELLGTSIERQELEVSSLVESYVVELLSGFTTATHVVRESIYLNDLLRKALDSEGLIRKEYLRVTGDIALFVSGIFPDRLESRHSWFNLGYYIDIGQEAYDNIDTDIFDELAIKFPELVEVLNEVSIKIDLTTADIERYIKRRGYIDVRTTRR